jgi:hypothetical protein
MRLSLPFRGVFWKGGCKVRVRYAPASHAKRDIHHVAVGKCGHITSETAVVGTRRIFNSSIAASGGLLHGTFANNRHQLATDSAGAASYRFRYPGFDYRG